MVITIEFLESIINYWRGRKCEFISLDELHQRLVAGKNFKSNRKFVCITFDDGYHNFTHAYPVLKKHEIPFAIYLVTGYPDGSILHNNMKLDV